MDMFNWLYMDFEGQKSAERLYQGIILFFGVVGFLVGYYYQMFSYTVGLLAVGSLVATLVCGIPWGYYRRHPLKWQPVRDSSGPATFDGAAPTTSHSEGKKRGKK